MMRYLLKNASMKDDNREFININILIEGRKITKISKNEINVPAIEYDLTGYTILPGFIHTHVHLFDCYDGFNEDKLKKWLQSGIIFLRDEGILSTCTAKDTVSWRDKIKKYPLCPGIAVCGKFISAVNGYGGIEPLEVASEQEARDAVKMQVDVGVDHIKIALERGYDAFTMSLAQLPLPILEAVCDEAYKQGKLVSAHVTASEQLEILLKAGIDEAAHTCADRISDETLSYMAAHHIAMTPTLSIYGEMTTNFGAPFLYTAMDNTKRFVDMGGVIGLGNDYMEEKKIWSSVGMPVMEIELLHQAGLTMEQVIDACTLGGAKILGREDLGRIKENCVADLIAVKGNPYQLPYLLSDVQFVMKSGIVVKQD